MCVKKGAPRQGLWLTNTPLSHRTQHCCTARRRLHICCRATTIRTPIDLTLLLLRKCKICCIFFSFYHRQENQYTSQWQSLFAPIDRDALALQFLICLPSPSACLLFKKAPYSFAFRLHVTTTCDYRETLDKKAIFNPTLNRIVTL